MALNLTPPTLDRTPSSHSRHVTAGVWCFERDFEGAEARPPVKLVVFDCDETLTLSTFMPRDNAFRTEIGWSSWPDYISMVNFESPFIGISRLEKLRSMLEELSRDCTLTVLTRNEGGAVACLNLLLMANLAQYFCAMWCMALRPGRPVGVYKQGEEWKTFNPPIARCADHKADVLHCIAEHPEHWFPQLQQAQEGQVICKMRELKPESIVLVDDVRTNFQRPAADGPKVLRYCKVARYDSEYRELGLVTDMGGIGARCELDFDILINFVQKPWDFKATESCRCVERSFEGAEARPPVSLIVFDFDETLSLYTFMPDDVRCQTEIGFLGDTPEFKEHFVKYNFQSPYVEGDRVAKLRELIGCLREGKTGQLRTLVVLTKNEAGAVCVLNLLLMADLADAFSGIWSLSAERGKPSGVYKNGDGWHTFSIPIDKVVDPNYKADVLHSVVENPGAWFPQLAQGAEEAVAGLRLEGIVLVDDERCNFQGRKEEQPVLRYCKVARYDAEYRDQGLLVHMGGLGAKTDEDYLTLQTFVERPWKYRESDCDAPGLLSMSMSLTTDTLSNSIPLERRHNQDDVKPFSPGQRMGMRKGSSWNSEGTGDGT